jgi:hypothetical protein
MIEHEQSPLSIVNAFVNISITCCRRLQFLWKGIGGYIGMPVHRVPFGAGKRNQTSGFYQGSHMGQDCLWSPGPWFWIAPFCCLLITSALLFLPPYTASSLPISSLTLRPGLLLPTLLFHAKPIFPNLPLPARCWVLQRTSLCFCPTSCPHAGTCL